MSTTLTPPVRSAALEAATFAARTAVRMMGPFLRPMHLLLTWPVASQLGARHNAKAAEEELLLRRAEREDVQLYLELLASERISA